MYWFAYITVGFHSIVMFFVWAGKLYHNINSHVFQVDYDIDSPRNTLAWLVILKSSTMFCSYVLWWAFYEVFMTEEMKPV